MRARLFAAVSVAVMAVPARGGGLDAQVDFSARTLAGERREAAAAPSGALLGAAEGADSAGPTILMSALYGGLAGGLVGLGVGLIENDNYGRDIAIGAGAGILIGAAVGATRAFSDKRSLAVTDGLSTPDRYPVVARARTLRVAGHF